MTNETVVEGDQMSTIPSEIARTWLLISAMTLNYDDDVTAAAADQTIVDLEDSVAPSLKDAARILAVDKLREGLSFWVRVNARSTPYWQDDLEALHGQRGLAGVMLAKVESGDEVTETHDLLGGATPVIPLIESALGIEEAVHIAKADGAFRLAFGSGDYRRDTGTSDLDVAMSYPRSRLVIASRIGNLPGPIDGPALTSEPSVLAERTASAAALGMTGKLCLQTKQVATINEALSPTVSEVTWARDFVALFESQGRVPRSGSDLPRFSRAQRIQQLAAAFDVKPF